MSSVFAMFTHAWLPVVAVVLVVAVQIIRIFSQAYWTPLRHIPGPRVAKFTNLVLKAQVIQGQRVQYIHGLHQRYGRFVRISPTEVAVSDLAAFRSIHKIGNNFHKSPWYAKFNDTPTPGIFAMVDPKAHAARRRLFAQPFSNSAILGYEATIRNKVELAVTKIERDGKAGNADLLKWWTAMATDVSGELSFGKSFNMLEQEEKTQYVRDLETTMMISGMKSELPWLVGLARWFPIEALQNALNLTKRLDSYGEAAIQNHKEYLAEKRDSYAPSLFSRFLDPAKQQTEISVHEIADEAKNFIVAGSDTTAVTLTYLVWAVLKPANRHVRQRLHEEVITLPFDAAAKDIAELGYLKNLIDETLRLYGAAPGSLPRMVPAEGAVLGEYQLTAGTTVSTQAFTMHRDGDIFPAPSSFRPERWEKPTAEMKDAYSPWGAGSRTCLGIHLAMLELQLAAFVFFRRCASAELAPTTTNESMEFENYFLIAPKAIVARSIYFENCILTMNETTAL